MEPISAVALSLALGAGAVAGKEMVSGLVKDGYAALKDLITKRYPNVPIEELEQAPGSADGRAIVAKNLMACGAAQDAQLAMAAQALIALVQRYAPTTASAVGIDLKDVTAANLRLVDVAASGTGVKMEGSTFTGDIEISHVRAGVPPDTSGKGG